MAITTPLILQPGIYSNVFPVALPETSLRAKTARRSEFPDPRALRHEFESEGRNIHVFADGGTVYAYGPDAGALEVSGFSAEDIDLARRPGLAKRLILEALADAAVRDGFEFRDRTWATTCGFKSRPRHQAGRNDTALAALPLASSGGASLFPLRRPERSEPGRGARRAAPTAPTRPYDLLCG